MGPMKTSPGVLSETSLNRNTWENFKSVATVKKPYLQAPSLLFLLLLQVHHLGRQGQDLLYSPSCPAVPVSLHGQNHTSDAAVDIVPSEQQQQQATQREPNAALRVPESGARGRGQDNSFRQYFFQLSFALVRTSFT